MADKEDPEYPIGYKKPPCRTQFKPGQSGNAKGRPKGAKNCMTVFQKELRTPIPVTENGKRKKISKLEAIIKHTVNKAAGGDSKATATVLSEVRFHESQNPPPALTAHASPEDEMVMDNILRRIRQADPTPLVPGPDSDPISDNPPDKPPEADEGEL